MGDIVYNTPVLTVLILTAGYGRRMGIFSRMINKSLVPYDNKALISHIIDKFDSNTKYVIAVGHLGQQVKDYISLVHKFLNVQFVDIENYDDGMTGPGSTIRQCALYLPESFMCITCDTLFKFDYKDKLDHNWIAVHPVDKDISKDYCWIERDGNNITAIYNKEQATNAVDAFIGLMYINDGVAYLNTLAKTSAREIFEGFIDLELCAHSVNEWLDFGTYDKWKELNNKFPEISSPKPDEIFYHDNNKIIKFSSNAELAKNKYLRGLINPTAMPKNLQQQGNFIAHDFVDGAMLYDHLTIDNFYLFLQWINDTMWQGSVDRSRIYDASINFYKKKTLQRIEMLRSKYPEWNEFSMVNGVHVKSITEYINLINFEDLANTSQFMFIHGDMQPENIIYNCETSEFTAIDWRSDFDGEMGGDIHYDIAKLLGGLYLSHRNVKKGYLEYEEKSDSVFINILSVENVQLYVDILKKWSLTRQLDWKKIEILVPLIYLNMSPLHDEPFDKYLIALSQHLFNQVL